MLVVGFHLWPNWLPGGFVGVDVFFVISGFLITAHLVRDTGRSGTVSLGRFWLRRAMRLLPAAYLTSIVTIALTLKFVPRIWWNEYFRQAIGSALYVQNWVLNGQATDYLNASDPPTAFQHFWSLSVEEQFYLALPLILLGCVLAGRRGLPWRRTFTAAVALLVAASFAWSVLLTHADPAAAYFVTTTRVWEFGAGCLLALVAGAPALRRLPAVTAWVGGVLILAAAFLLSGRTPFPGYAAALPVVGAVLVLATPSNDRVFRAVTGVRPVQMIGDASYSIYLWHWPLAIIVPYAVGHPLAPAQSLALMAASLVIGWLSMRFVETPFRMGRGPRTRSQRVGPWAISGLLASNVAVAAIGLYAIAHQKVSLDRPSNVAVECWGAPALHHRCALAPRVVPSPVALARDNAMLLQPQCFAGPHVETPALCTFGRDDAPTRVLAVGDSHLAALVPALQRIATSLDWHLEVSTKGGCWPVTTPKDFDHAGPRALTIAQQRSCQSWIDWVHQRETDKKYDVVLTSHRHDLYLQSNTEHNSVPMSVQALHAEWTGLARSGTKVVAIEDVPRSLDRATKCQSESEDPLQLRRCVIPQSWAYPPTSLDESAAKGLTNVAVIRTRDLFCRDHACPTVIGGVRLFANQSHLTSTFAATLAPEYTRRIRDGLGALS